MLDIKTGENYRAAADRLQTERDEARAHVAELEAKIEDYRGRLATEIANVSGGDVMQPLIFEQAYCRICRKPYRAVPAEYGLTVYRPDCFHGVVASDGTAPNAILQPKR